ncbi:MAG TPA: DUF2007 domain-containing protein [Planctomycetota bacterium]|jgi:hypothetical protein|nr:DUF2007 domain-containing protein [Planctomycetota bacterium]OQC20805.1 MAG: hypothetical protein BWX69_01431 [Planctomycetes bacterium ADurb.Bin069]NMD34951.1 DUF2007 domain-containing protein [Planctomycetota bacterium]HNR99365.1 DUF2007 domain-containing protein [Planctomycetota bacterium]HNU25584.1 DUF2007 domain-containing protein [Planctomycetota bacterium]
MADKDLVIAEAFTSDSDAAVARSVLEEAGIAAVVASGDAGGAFPHFQTLGSVKLLVRPEDLARAQAILRRKEPLTDAELARQDSPAELASAELDVRGARKPLSRRTKYAILLVLCGIAVLVLLRVFRP